MCSSAAATAQIVWTGQIDGKGPDGQVVHMHAQRAKFSAARADGYAVHYRQYQGTAVANPALRDYGRDAARP